MSLQPFELDLRIVRCVLASLQEGVSVRLFIIHELHFRNGISGLNLNGISGLNLNKKDAVNMKLYHSKD